MTEIFIKKINNEKVKPLVIYNNNPPEKILGYDLFPDIYCNIFIASKKRSGKTSLIGTILNKCANKHTKVIIVCSTVNKDPSYELILQKLDKRSISYQTHLSLKDGVLNQFKILQEKPKEETKIEKLSYICCSSDDDEEPIKKSRKISPEYIVVIDDLAPELGNTDLAFLMSKNRHLKMKIIISSQYYQNLLKFARAQIDYLIMFGGMPTEKLAIMYKEMDLSIDYDLFLKLYADATREKYSFFYVDVRNEIFRKNLNEQYFKK